MKSYIINTETNQWPIYQGDFELAHPTQNSNNPEYPYKWVMETPIPEIDWYTQEIKEQTPKEDQDTGIWYRQWSTIDKVGAALEFGLKQKKVDELNARGIPPAVSMRQARLQLLSLGKYDEINTAINSMSTAAQIEWEYATEVDRFNPLVPAMQELLQWSDEEMDTYFIEASKL